MLIFGIHRINGLTIIQLPIILIANSHLIDWIETPTVIGQNFEFLNEILSSSQCNGHLDSCVEGKLFKWPKNSLCVQNGGCVVELGLVQ